MLLFSLLVGSRFIGGIVFVCLACDRGSTFLCVVLFLLSLLIKDFLAVIPILLILLHFIFYYPDSLGHYDNYIKADSLVTPTHIVPE